MADEATVRSSLQVIKGNLSYQSQPTTFQADVSGTAGPSPGTVIVPTTGVDIYFSQLTTPGLCRLQNLDTGNRFEYGIYDTSNKVFYPLGEVLPGETYVIRLSRNLKKEFAGSGTGQTLDTYLRLKAYGASVTAQVEAFEV